MNINLIIEVIASIHVNFFDPQDTTLPDKARAARAVPEMPVNVTLSDFTHNILGKKLICLIGEREKTIKAAQAMIDAFNSPVDVVILGGWDGKGNQLTDGESVLYPIDHDKLLGYVSRSYLSEWESMTLEQQAMEDPFWRTSGQKRRKLV